jgi:hypothetical protein
MYTTMQADIADTLYSVIDEIGREKIRVDVSSSVDRSAKYCEEIVNKCMARLGSRAGDEEIVTLCEALLHFMLTASVLPSERKVNFKDVDLDLVIPSMKMLNKSPDKALVIQVIKNSGDLGRIRQAESVQPHHENIWVLSARRLETDHKRYYLGSKKDHHPYFRIIQDVNAFLVGKKVKGLKLLHGQ